MHFLKPSYIFSRIFVLKRDISSQLMHFLNFIIFTGQSETAEFERNSTGAHSEIHDSSQREYPLLII